MNRNEFTTVRIAAPESQRWRPNYTSNAVAILVQDDCGWSSHDEREVCCSATFVCPHVAHCHDYWTFDTPAERRELTQRFVQEFANEKTGCHCGLEPTDLDFGFLDGTGRMDGRLLGMDGVNTITVQFEPSGRVATFNFDTGELRDKETQS